MFNTSQSREDEKPGDDLISSIKNSNCDKKDVQDIQKLQDIISIGERLGQFSPLIWCLEFACCLTHFEALAKHEHNKIRVKAVKTLRMICSLQSNENLEETFVPLVERLSTDDKFPSKISACSLFAVCYARVKDPIKAKLRSLYYKLLTDNSMAIRMEAIIRLTEFVEDLEPEYIKSDLIPLFASLIDFDMYPLRLIILEVYMCFASMFSDDDVVELIVPRWHNCLINPSWKVRHLIIKNFIEFQNAVGPAITCSHLIPGLQMLLADPHEGIRIVTLSKIHEIVFEIPQIDRDMVFINDILPCLKELISDPKQDVKVMVVKSIMKLSSVLSKESTQKQLLPLFSNLLNDDQWSSHKPEVWTNISSHLDNIVKVVDTQEILQLLLPFILKLSEDNNWRTRSAIIESIPTLAKNFGVLHFNKLFKSISVSGFNDKVNAIRQAMAFNLKTLVQNFGSKWAQNNIIPEVLTLSSHSNYSYRITFLLCMNALIQACSKHVKVNILLPAVLKMATDPVSNVRFNVAKTLGQTGYFFKPKHINSEIKPALEKLMEDKDADVRYFATEAIKAFTNS